MTSIRYQNLIKRDPFKTQPQDLHLCLLTFPTSFAFFTLLFRADYWVFGSCSCLLCFSFPLLLLAFLILTDMDYFGSGCSLTFVVSVFSMCIYGSLFSPEIRCLWDFALYHAALGARSQIARDAIMKEPHCCFSFPISWADPVISSVYSFWLCFRKTKVLWWLKL